MKKRLTYLLLTALAGLCSCSSGDVPQPPQKPAPRFNVSDSLVLTEIYKAADGDNWLPSWDLENIRTWGGVSAVLDTTTNEYRVVQLMMNQANSSDAYGYLSPRIGDLPYLMYLTLGGRNISGELPKTLGKLKYLNYVWISGTSISGKVPKEIFSCPNLDWLNLSGNQLTGGVPEEITRWDNPEGTCYLLDNHLSGKIPSGLKIRVLKVSDNEFTEYPFEYAYPGTSWVEMKRNRITGTIPDDILNNAKAVEKLRISTMFQKEGYGFSNEPEEWDIYTSPYEK